MSTEPNRSGVTSEAKGAPQEFIALPAEFMTDDGPHKMTYDDAKKIVALFEARGNDMSIDYDHASTDTKAPPESRVAAGWIPCPGGLEAREDGSVWVVKVKWDSAVSAWLSADVPKYKYLSPWYGYRESGGVAVPTRLVNIALTNNPKTWECWRLASLALPGVDTMNEQDMKAAGMALLALVALIGAQDAGLADWAKEQDAALRAKLGEDASKAMELAKPDDSVLPPAPAPMDDAAVASVEKTEEEKQAVASLAKMKPGVIRVAADKVALEKLIESNKAVIPANAIPLLRKASLADATEWIADVTSGARVPAKSQVVPRDITAGRGKQVDETRVASLAKQYDIKDPGKVLRANLVGGSADK